MKKILSFILLGCLLSIGNLWADETATATIDFGTSYSSLVTISHTHSSQTTWSLVDATLGSSSTKAASSAYSVKAAGTSYTTKNSYNSVSSISLYVSTSDKGKTYLTVEISPNEDFSSDVTTVQALAVMNGGGLPTNMGNNNQYYLQTYTVNNVTGYVRVTVSEASGSSGKTIRVGNISVTYSAGPAKEIASQTLNGVKINSVAAEAADYSIVGNTITLTNSFVSAPTIALVNHIIYTDNSSKDEDVAVTLSDDNAGHFSGTGTIGTTTYTVVADKQASYTITYKDGETSLGTELVAENGNPTASEINTTKELASFGGWFILSDLSGSAVALNNLVITQDTTLYGKWNVSYTAADASYNFQDNATVSGKTITTSEVTYDAFQIDNLFFSSMKLAYDNGSSDVVYKGWKIKTENATIKLIAQTDRRLSITTGNLAGMQVIYTKVDGSSDTKSLSANTVNKVNVKANKVVTLKTTSSSTNVLKAIALSDIPVEAAPTIVVPKTNVSTLENTAVTLSVNVDGAPEPTVTWYQSETATTSGGTSKGTGTSYNPSVTTIGTFYFYAVASNGINPDATSELITLTVQPVDVTISGNNYYVAVGDKKKDGSKVTCDDIVMEYNCTGTINDAIADNMVNSLNSNYVASITTGTNGWGVTFTPESDGVLSVGVVINGGKKFSITNASSFNYNGLQDEGNNTTSESSGTNESHEWTPSKKQYTIITLHVMSGTSYKFSVAGSKMAFYGFEFTPDFALVAADANFYGMYLEEEVTIPANVEAFTGKLNDNQTQLNLTQVTGSVIPAATPVLVKASAAGTYYFAPSATSAAAIANNDLKGVATETAVTALAEDGKTVLTLGVDVEGVIGFRKPAGDNIAANKVYLLVDTPAQGAPSIRIVMGENNTTDINSLEASEKAQKFFENGNLYILRDGVVYDATGRVVR